jgi:hypothetical protein
LGSKNSNPQNVVMCCTLKLEVFDQVLLNSTPWNSNLFYPYPDHDILDRNPDSGENLPRMDYFGLCDPYLKITVDGYTAKTEVIKVSLNPEWKETINIPIFQARALPNCAALTR